MSYATGHCASGKPWAAYWLDQSWPTIDPARFLNWQDVVIKTGPVVLWTAEPMASAHTGMRPDGESAKLHGAWWKVEPWTDAKIHQHTVDRATLNVMMFDQFASTASFDPFKPHSAFKPHSVMRELTKAIDEAFKSGITRDQITALVDTRLVVQTMED